MSFWSASRKDSYWSDWTGNSPANTRGCTDLKPGSGFSQGRDSLVIVSPTGAPSMSLIPAVIQPTSPVDSASVAMRFGVKRPTWSTCHPRPVDITWMRSFGRSAPFMTRTSETTPT